MLRKRKVLKVIALTMATNLLLEIFLPTAAYALTSGPHAPEYSSFEPVSTTDMVNLTSGQFVYNLPVLEIAGPDGGGYGLSLSYHNGANSEEEASWVGLGWSLNPGALNRQSRGYPDDYNGVRIHKYNKTRPNISASYTNSVGLEFFSKKEDDVKKPIESPENQKDTDEENDDTALDEADVGMGGKAAFIYGVGNAAAGANKAGLSKLLDLGVKNSIRFNNYTGFGRYLGFDIGAKGLGGMGFNMGTSGNTFSAHVNVPAILSKFRKKQTEEPEGWSTKKRFLKKLGNYASTYASRTSVMKQLGSAYGSTYGIYSFGEHVISSSMARMQRGRSSNWALGVSATFNNINSGVNTGFRGNVTVKRSEPVVAMDAYGYLHTPNDMQEAALQDYYVEKNSPYQKRNLFIGIPFNNADHFIYTGEGIGGAMRFFPRSVGTFYPNPVKNVTDIFQGGFDLNIGASVGIGADFGFGSQKSIVKKWQKEGNTGQADFDNTGGAFRFKGDKAGSVSYGESDLKVAKLEKGWFGAEANLDDLSDFSLKSEEFSHSSYVQHHTVGNISQSNRFNKMLDLAQLNSIAGTHRDLIVETQVHNADGIRYVYGQPVFNRRQANLQFDVKKSTDKLVGKALAFKTTALHTSPKGYEVDTKNPMHETVVGEINNAPYASTYLLTQIFTYDYVDVGNNGIDSADFGGWTQFHYHKAYGEGSEKNDWYRWRNPYNGLLYHENSLSDSKDNTGSVTTAEKEVFYLKAIETKTHIAFFVTNEATPERFKAVNTFNVPAHLLTGSGNKRLDGLGAARLTATNDPASEAEGTKDVTQRTEYLEKIVLFHKKRPDKPIKTTHFQYDYSLVKNVPNNEQSNYPASRNCNNCGKLTLKKVWFTYEGIHEARTSPFVFDYKYKDFKTFTPNVQDRYGDILQANRHYSDAAQNPDYHPTMLDAWGNVQFDAANRKAEMKNWVGQQSLTSAEQESYDPAAWQLKQITLPSGGQILIEYEEKDYSYIQDRAPMTMVSLMGDGENHQNHPYYDINIADLGIEEKDIPEQIEQLKAYFSTEKMYFKFLYKLIGEGTPTLDDCKSEYITGYTKVDAANIHRVNNTIRIPLASQKNYDGYTATPLQACYDFYSTKRVGKWHQNDGYDCVGAFENEMEDEVWRFENNYFERIAYVTKYMAKLAARSLDQEYGIPAKSQIGKAINYELSYLKLPMIKAKRGGGIRVKRLLMYDYGIEGEGVLLGQEYNYEEVVKDRNDNIIKVISSGVVDSEPALEDDALVTFLPRKNQQWYSRITAGKDKAQSEGPLGRSIISGNTVMHSRVVVENIHKGETGTGFTVHEFTTPKDYPFDMPYRLGDETNDYHSDLKSANSSAGFAYGVQKTPLSDNQKVLSLAIPAGLFFYKQRMAWMTQGFRFIRMQYGQPKQIVSYEGDYNPETLDYAVRSSAQVYEYYQPGEKVRMLQPDGKLDYQLPGKETDIAMESKSVLDKTFDFAIDVDLAIGLTPPPPVIVSASLSFSLQNEKISTHATSKVIDYPAIVKSVTAFQNGVESKTENLAFNPITGQVMLTRTSDAFDRVAIANHGTHDGSIYSLNLPAAWYYDELGRKFENGIDYGASRSNQLSAGVSAIIAHGTNGNPLTSDSTWHIPKDVLRVDLQTYDKNWLEASKPYYEVLKQDYQITDQAKSELNKVWRASKAYTYRDNVTSANTISEGIRKGGMMAEIAFPTDKDWSDGIGDLDSKWILSSEVKQYTPNGQPIEEENALGIPSTVKFGYHNVLPTMVATNARYTGIYFNDFETAEGARIATDRAHSGKHSLHFQAADQNTPIMEGLISDEILKPTIATQGLKGGARIRMWVRGSDAVNLGIKILSTVTPMTKVARTGEWSLYQADISKEDLPDIGDQFEVFLAYDGSEELWLDDMKLQPLDAQGTCYVYDVATFRLLTQFDDQHFGLYYQYDAEGKLMRKLIETERGLKTVSETQYNTKKVSH
ncbi:MAG: hypothetical protein ACPGJS_05885 [Flammeovirgaceae bacterium]